MTHYRVVAIDVDFSGISSLRIASMAANSDEEAKVRAYETFFEDKLEEGANIDEVLEEQDCSASRIELITNVDTEEDIFDLSGWIVDFEIW